MLETLGMVEVDDGLDDDAIVVARLGGVENEQQRRVCRCEAQ